ncbi:MAG: JAB domain-containing protein [Acidobacteriota bacterium]
MPTETTRLRELTVRYTVKKDDEGRPVLVGRVLMTSHDSAAVLVPIFQHEPSEVFGVLFLSTRHRVIAYHEVGRGSLDTVLVTPREVFKAAILANAAAVILCHGHPSGDPTPSSDDIALTRRLAAAGTLLGIEVLDHIIVGDAGHVSLRDRGCF